MINRAGRLQYTDRIVEYQQGSEAEWRLFNRLAEQLGGKLVTVGTERELTLSLLGSEPRLQGAKLSAVKQGGICLKATLGSVVSASHASTSGGDQPGAV
jgi:NADH dehydrogenase/NADH:ubiquinone oxidoreductase subunit G